VIRERILTRVLVESVEPPTRIAIKPILSPPRARVRARLSWRHAQTGRPLCVPLSSLPACGRLHREPGRFMRLPRRAPCGMPTCPRAASVRVATRDALRIRSRFGDRPFSESRAARSFTSAEGSSLGGGSLTPARRAFERSDRDGCLADRAPCFPSRMWSISSRMNSPACVDGAFPWRDPQRHVQSTSVGHRQLHSVWYMSI